MPITIPLNKGRKKLCPTQHKASITYMIIRDGRHVFSTSIDLNDMSDRDKIENYIKAKGWKSEDITTYNTTLNKRKTHITIKIDIPWRGMNPNDYQWLLTNKNKWIKHALTLT